MQEVSRQYKEIMKRKWINRLCHMRVSIGVVNQDAQASAQVPDPEAYEYYSDFYKPLNNYAVRENELYAACDEGYTVVDSGMFFLPEEKEAAVLNQGIVTRQLLGAVRIVFQVPQDIKGLTVEFGRAWPVDFVIRSDHREVEINGNGGGHFTTDEVFEGTTCLEIVPFRMRYGQNRLRIHQIVMGMGIYFSGHEIRSATKQEYISPVSEELPTMDFSVTVENRDRKFDIENAESAVNFLQAGQSVEVLYGQELDSGEIEWIPGTTLLLKDWEVDDSEMSFSASDRFSDLNGTYYRGMYHPEGISLHDLAVDVLEDAGIDLRQVWLDPYLRDVMISNPMPVVMHREALQLIANAGRCVLSHGRNQNIYMKSSFVQSLTAGSGDGMYYSSPETILNGREKTVYASTSLNYTKVDAGACFLPREGAETVLDAGYVSGQISDGQGMFAQNPSVMVYSEAAYKNFGLTFEFGENPPEELRILVFYEEELMEAYTVTDVGKTTAVSHEFPEWDRMEVEIRRGKPHSGTVLHSIIFGESTDYVLEYGTELKKTPTGKQLQKVRELQVMRTLYSRSQVSDVELAREKISITSADSRYTLYLNNPSYGLSCAVEPAAGRSAEILESSCYYATLELSGVQDGEEVEVVVYGREYVPSCAKVTRQLHTTGVQEVWDNPLVSDLQHAVKLADWIGDYLKTGKEYEISYRGDARIDGNDLMTLENRYVKDMKIRVYRHTLEYNGTLSGKIMAKRVE